MNNKGKMGDEKLAGAGIKVLRTAEAWRLLRQAVPEIKITDRSSAKRALALGMQRSDLLRNRVRELVGWSHFGVRPLSEPNSPHLKALYGALLDHMTAARKSTTAAEMAPRGVPRVRPSLKHVAVAFGRTVREVEKASILETTTGLGMRLDPLSDVAQRAIFGDDSGQGSLLEIGQIFRQSATEDEQEQRESLNYRGILHEDRLAELTADFAEVGINLAEALSCKAGDQYGDLESAQYRLWAEDSLIKEKYVYRPLPEEGRLDPDASQLLVDFIDEMARKEESRTIGYTYQWAGVDCGQIAFLADSERRDVYERVDMPASYPSEPEWAESLTEQYGGLEFIDPAMVEAARVILKDHKGKFKPTLEAQVLRLLARERREWGVSAERHRAVHRARSNYRFFNEMKSNPDRSLEEDQRLSRAIAEMAPHLKDLLQTLQEGTAKLAAGDTDSALIKRVRDAHQFLGYEGYVARREDRALAKLATKAADKVSSAATEERAETIVKNEKPAPKPRARRA